MPVDALLLALAAAFVHAAWNLLLSGSEDTHSATAVALAAGAIVFVPVAALTWRLEGSAWPYVAASNSLELCCTAYCSPPRTQRPRWGSSIRSRAARRSCSS